MHQNNYHNARNYENQICNNIQECSILFCQYIVDHFSINKSTLFFGLRINNITSNNIIYCTIYWDYNILWSIPDINNNNNNK